jgi:hypothetical protein
MTTIRETLPDGNQRIVEETPSGRPLRTATGTARNARMGNHARPGPCRAIPRPGMPPRARLRGGSNGSLVVVVERIGTRLSEESLCKRAVFSVSLPAFLARQATDLESVEFAVIDGRLESPQARARLPAADAGQRWACRGKGDDAALDGPMAIVGSIVSKTDRTFRRATAEQAAAIEHLVFSPRELLVFPVKRHTVPNAPELSLRETHLEGHAARVDEP